MPADLPPLIIHAQPLPYESRLTVRETASIDLVVIHCTELPDLAMARQFGEQVLYNESGTGNSGHFYIDRDGAVYAYVDPRYIAHHTKGYNAHSIGIELVNVGRYPDWLASTSQAMRQPYTEPQINALIGLLKELQRRYPSLRQIAGHEELDRTRVPATDDEQVLVARKMDPGPLFPWQRVLNAVSLSHTPVSD